MTNRGWLSLTRAAISPTAWRFLSFVQFGGEPRRDRQKTDSRKRQARDLAPQTIGTDDSQAFLAGMATNHPTINVNYGAGAVLLAAAEVLRFPEIERAAPRLRGCGSRGQELGCILPPAAAQRAARATLRS